MFQSKNIYIVENSLQDFSWWFSPSGLLVFVSSFSPLLYWIGVACRILWKGQEWKSWLSHKRQSGFHHALSWMNALGKPDAVLWEQWWSPMERTPWCWTQVSNSQQHLPVSRVSEPPWTQILQLQPCVPMTAPWQHLDSNLIESREAERPT